MELMKGSDISWYYLTRLEDISILTSLLDSKYRLAIDTEVKVLPLIGASVFDPHTSRIRLIQINWDGNNQPMIVDVDKVGIDNLKPFVEYIASEKFLKVIHNATYDLKQFRSTFGVWLKNVHCTKVAMQTLGISVGYKGSTMRGHSLKSLARDYFGITLNKIEADSDWGASELRIEQLEYAALDVGAPKSSGIDSILLEGYNLVVGSVIGPKPEGFDQWDVFITDQQAMYVAAIAEYNGMYIDINQLQKIEQKAYEEMETSRYKLCAALGLTLDQEVIIDEDGSPRLVTVVPDRVATLLNNNKKLVVYINQILSKTGLKLSSLQAKELEKALDEITSYEKSEEEDDEEGELHDDENEEDFKDYGIELIKDLLNYKKYVKLLSEARKYESITNPVTGRVHAGFNSIGAATGRMSSSGDLNLQQVSNFTFDIYEDVATV